MRGNRCRRNGQKTSTSTTVKEQSEVLLTIDEARKILHSSRKTTAALIDSGYLPVLNLGKPFVKERELEDFLRRSEGMDYSDGTPVRFQVLTPENEGWKINVTFTPAQWEEMKEFPPTFTPDEVCSLLGVADSVVMGCIHLGLLPAVILNSRIVIMREWLFGFVYACEGKDLRNRRAVKPFMTELLHEQLKKEDRMT